MRRSEEALGRQEPDGPCVSRGIFALRCFASIRALLNLQSRRPNPGTESTIAPLPLRVRYSTAAQTLLSSRCKQEARRVTQTSELCGRWTGSPRTGRFGPQGRWIASRKKLSMREGERERIDENGVIAQTVTSELLSYPFHSDTALR